MPKVSKEHQILFQTLKGDQFLLNEDINPDRLFSLYQRHRLFPLASGIIELLDEKERGKWKTAIQARIIKALHYTSVLSNIISEFNKKGIEAISLKGPVLVSSLYGDVGQRQFRDLDLLVRKENLTQAVKILKEKGFELFSPAAEFSERQWDYYYRYKYDITLINKGQGVIIELHTSIYYPRLFNASKENLLSENLMEIVVGGIAVKSMNRDNTLLYLAIHGGHHLFFRLFWLRDVAEVIKRWELDHAKILENAKQLEVERLLGVSLELAKEFFNVEIPEEYRSYLKEDAKCLKRLKRICTKAILGPEFSSFWGRMKRLFFFLSLRPGLRYKWKVVISFLHRWHINNVLGGH